MSTVWMVMGFTGERAARLSNLVRTGQLYASQEAKLYMCEEILTGKLYVLHFSS